MTSDNKRHKSFGGRNRKSSEPISFDIDGEEFHCHKTIPGASLIDFSAAATSDNSSEATRATLDFFKSAMSEEEHARFDEFIRDPEREVEIEDLAEIIEWLIEEYTNRRPTQ